MQRYGGVGFPGDGSIEATALVETNPKQFGYLVAGGNGVKGVGMTDVVTQRGGFSGGFDADGHFGSQSGTNSGTESSQDITRLDQKPVATFKLSFADALTDVRMGAWLTDSILANNADVDNPLVNNVGIFFRSGTDTNFQFTCCDGVTRTFVDSGVAPVAGKTYLVRIKANSATSVKVELREADGNLLAETTLTTNLPAATVELKLVGGNRQSSAPNKACRWYIASVTHG